MNYLNATHGLLCHDRWSEAEQRWTAPYELRRSLSGKTDEED